MRAITRDMIKLYNLDHICFMGYKLNKNNATYHHIVKKEDGGLLTIDNGAILSDVAHSYLHIIEYKDIEIYFALNKIFEIINKQRSKPTKEQYSIINALLMMFEEEHKSDKTSKGKMLIKHAYLEREIRFL